MKCYVLFLLYFLVHLVVFIFVGVCSSNVDLCFLYHYQEMNFQKLSLGVCKGYNSSSVIIANWQHSNARVLANYAGLFAM